MSREQLDNGQAEGGRTVDRFFGTCTSLQSTAGEARALMAAEVRQDFLDHQHQYPDMKQIGGGWRVRGTRSE